MAIVLTCPRCDRKYSVGDAMAGRRVTCKGCGQEFPVPGGPKPGQSSAWDDDDGGVIGFAPPPRGGAYADAPARDSAAADPSFRPPVRAKARSSGARAGPALPWWTVQGPARYFVVIVLGLLGYLGLVGARAMLTDRGNTPEAHAAVALMREYAANLDDLSGLIENLAVGESAEGLASQTAQGKARMTALMDRMQAHGGLTDDEGRYLKREAGPTMRKALARIKAALKKFEGLPAFAGQLAMMNADFDRQLAHWDGPTSGVAPSPPPQDEGTVAAAPPPPKPVEVVIPADADADANADAVTRSILELKTSDLAKTMTALKRLQETPPDARAAEVVQTVLPFFAPGAPTHLRPEAVHVLTAWPTEEGIAALRKGVADDFILVRRESMQGLGELKDLDAIDAIVDRLPLENEYAMNALIAYGPVAETPLIARLKSDDPRVRASIYRILEKVGGTETIMAMKAMPPDDDTYAQTCAGVARSAIAKRVRPSPESPKSKAKPAVPARAKAKR